MKRLMSLLVVASSMLVMLWSSPVPGQGLSLKYDDLLKRLPAGCNALMMVDVEGLYKSKLGVREQWEKNSVDAKGRGILFPVDATRSVTASNINLENGEIRWKVGMVKMAGRLPNLAGIAKADGGHLDKVQLTPVLRTTRDFYLFSFPDGVLGFASPADRQLLDNWIQASIVHPVAARPRFADRAIFRADRTAQIAIALDLEHAISPDAAEDFVNELSLVKKLKLDPKPMAVPLASAKSALLTIEVTEQVRGELRVEFDDEVKKALGPVAKELMLAALENHGIGLKDMAKWQAEIGDTSIALSGPLTKESGRRILSLVSPPQLDAPSYSSRHASAADPAPADDPQPVTPKTVQETSRHYYRSVVELLDGLKAEKSETSRGMRLWYDRYSRRVDDLPILNVDKELVDYAAQVSQTLREMAGGINYSSKNQSYRMSNTGGYNYYGYGSSKKSDYVAIKQQEEATLSVQLDARWQEILNATADMRRKMVDRYKVEF